MFSFYSLPSTAVKVKPLTYINAAYLFYYASTSCPACSDLGDGSVSKPITNWKDETPEERLVLKERLKLVVGDALIVAHKVSSLEIAPGNQGADELIIEQAGFDVFNALTLQDNSLFLEDLNVSFQLVCQTIAVS